MDTTGQKQYTARELLNDAAEVIAERSRTHGHYDITLLRTAKLWTDFLEREIDPTDVAICMALLKIARSMESRNNADNFLDLCSYAAIAGSLAVKDWNDLDA